MTNSASIGWPAFPTTHWSLVGNAAHIDDSVKRRAVVELLTRYMPPLKSHLVLRKRIDPHRADDLMQGFLVSKVLEQDLIARAQRERGRFRTFLLTAMDHFIISQARHDRAAKRAPVAQASLPEGDLQPPQTGPEPHEQFDIGWARQVLAQAIDRMREECRASDRPDLWGVFEHRVLRPLLAGEQPMEYQTLVHRFGLPSPAQASNVLMTAKRMFARCLRGVIGEYEKDPADVEAEIADLREILSRARA